MRPSIPYRYTGPAPRRSTATATRDAATPVRDTPPHEAAAMKQLISEQLVKYLEDRGVEYLFGLCGHTNIAVLDGAEGLVGQVRQHPPRADRRAHGRRLRARQEARPRCVLSHLGPGLTNASTGVANAALDSIPMVVIAGDIPSHYYGKHPHQEVNLHADASQSEIYRPFVKRVWRVERPDLFPEILEKAFQLAESGRPGPGAGLGADGHLLDGGRHRAVRAPGAAHARRCTSRRWTTRPPRRSSARCSKPRTR